MHSPRVTQESAAAATKPTVTLCIPGIIGGAEGPRGGVFRCPRMSTGVCPTAAGLTAGQAFPIHLSFRLETTIVNINLTTPTPPLPHQSGAIGRFRPINYICWLEDRAFGNSHSSISPSCGGLDTFVQDASITHTPRPFPFLHQLCSLTE